MSSTETAPTETPAAQPAAPAPPAQDAAAGLLRQTEALKTANEQSEQEKQNYVSENQQLKAQLAAFLQQYKEANEQKALDYIKGMEESLGKPLDEPTRFKYMAAFTKPEYKKDADLMWQTYENQKAVNASKKKLEEEVARMKQETEALREAVVKASANVARVNTASALAAAEQSPVTEQRKEVPVNASRRTGGGAIQLKAPGNDYELSFLREAGFSNDRNINASALLSDPNYNGPTEFQPLRESLPAIPPNPIEVDPWTKQKNFPNSWRYTNDVMMSFWLNCSGLTTDLPPAEMITVTKDKIKPKRDADSF